MVLFPSNIFKKLKINIEIDTGLSFSQDVSSSGILSSLSGMPACERLAYRGYHEGLSFIRNETRKTGKEKGEKITLIYRVFFWDLNWGIRGVASRLVTRDPDRELAGRGKVHCVRTGASPARASLPNFPQTRTRGPAPRLQQVQAMW